MVNQPAYAPNIHEDTTPEGETEDSELHVLVSRYVHLGLNRGPASLPARSSACGRNLAKSVKPARGNPLYADMFAHPTPNDENLTELEDMMAAQEPSSTFHHISTSWQPINCIRTSKYTTGILNTSGWQPINRDLGFTGSNTQDDNLAKVPGEENSVVTLHSDNEDGMELCTTGKADETDPTTWLDDKYFDHYGYLNYIGSDSVKIVEMPVTTLKKSTKNKIRNKSAADTTREAKTGRSQLLLDEDSKPDVPKGTKNRGSTNKPAVVLKPTSEQTDKWELLEGTTDAPRINNVSPDKLFIKLRNTSTAELKTLTFSNMEHEDIDWNSRAHVTVISQWRNEAFLRHGLELKKQVVVYTPSENAWLDLLHRKLRGTVEAGHVFKLPGPVPVTEAFNEYFEGRVVKAADGEDAPPRSARNQYSVRTKLNGKICQIAKGRSIIRGLLEGKKSKELYMPVITEEELAQFMEDGTVVIDDPADIGKDRATMEDREKDMRAYVQRKQGETSDEWSEAKRPKMK